VVETSNCYTRLGSCRGLCTSTNHVITSRTNGRNNAVATMRQRVQNRPLKSMLRAKVNGQRSKVKVVGDDATKSLKNITCHYCGKVGHMKKHCRKMSVDHKTNQGGPQQKAHVAKHIKESRHFTNR
jgi:hypothetical protein